MSMHIRINPPWTNRALKDNWQAINDFAHERDLPLPVDAGRYKFEELGCGNYGCVIETSDPSIVFKVTSDPTEAEFIQLAEPLGWPDGIVRYYGILPLEASFKKRDVYAIWREAAFNIGELYERYAGTDQPFYREMRRLELRLIQFKDHAARLRDTLKRAKDPGKMWAEAKALTNWAWQSVGLDTVEGNAKAGLYFRRQYRWFESQRGSYRVAASFRACEIIAELMENEYKADSIGVAFSFYLEKDIVLADVHANNVGQVLRKDSEYNGEIWVITDPGHAVVLG